VPYIETFLPNLHFFIGLTMNSASPPSTNLDTAMTYIMSVSGCSEEFLYALVNNLPPPSVSFVVSAKKKQEVNRLIQLGLPKPKAYQWVSGHFYATYLFEKYIVNPDLFISSYVSYS